MRPYLYQPSEGPAFTVFAVSDPDSYPYTICLEPDDDLKREVVWDHQTEQPCVELS